MIFKEEGGGGEVLEWKFQVSRYKLLNIEWILKKYGPTVLTVSQGPIFNIL